MKKRFLLSIAVMFFVSAISFAQLALPVQGEKIILNKNWIAKQAGYVLADGSQLSSGQYEFTGWLKATVPGTVLTTLLDNRLIPSPYFGMNNELIPDICNVGNAFYTYWFVNRFKLSKNNDDEKLWLNFRGINYKAEIFLNGKRVSTTTHEGMFLRKSYDITAAVKYDSINTLAVIVYPPDYPGEPNGGQGGDGQIARNNTMHYTPGWDWIQPVRDRNTGIWDEVAITTSGSIRLLHPQIITKVPGIRTPGNKQADAQIKVTAEVENLTALAQNATVVYKVENNTLSAKIKLNPYEKKVVTFPDLTVKNPRLWWPNGIGKPELYSMELSALDNNSKISDKQNVQFGIRELSSEKDSATGGRKFYVNGQKIFIRGGNYIISDWMLQLSPERYRTEVAFHADMNLNMIRVWGGAIPERPEFYDACDSLGMLVFQDLSVTGDANGAWIDPKKKDSKERRCAYPDNHELFLTSVIDEIKMLRNHPSLCVWCGGNEWPAAEDVLPELKNNIFPQYDNTRCFADYSVDTSFTRNTMGGVGDGPYGIQEPEWFFSNRSTPFNPELGSVGVPEAAAMRAIMSEKDFNDFPKPKGRVNEVWDYHKYIAYGDHIERYGHPKSGEEFCNIAQLLNYEQYRALMEGRGSNMWSWYTGMLIWKTQNPWTALRGQMYDCYLDVNACYDGTKKGGEPLHAQYNMSTKKVEIVNTTLSNKEKLTVTARLYSLDGKLINEQSQPVSIAANTTQVLFDAPQPTGVNGVYFLRLHIKDDKTTYPDNTYWLTTKPNEYTQFQHMPPAKASLQVALENAGTKYTATIQVKAGDNISFFNHVAVFNNKTGERILPVFYSDNYFTVFPNEAHTSTLTFQSNLSKDDIVVKVKSWN